MKTLNTRIFAVLAVGWLMLWQAGGRALAGSEPIVTSDLLRLRNVGAIDVSRDGRFAVVAVRSIERNAEREAAEAREKHAGTAEPRWMYQSHLYLVDLIDEHAAVKQLTFGNRRDGGSKISPDGKWVAFIRAGKADDADGRRSERESGQVWVLSLDGGEARQVTRLEHGAGEIEWSPDGREVVFTSDVLLHEMEGVPPWPMERPKRAWKDEKLSEGLMARPDGTREEIRAWLAQNARDENPTVINRIEFQDEQDLKVEMSFSQVFAVDVVKDGAQPVMLTKTFCDHHEPVYMPDGSGVVYTAKTIGDKHLDRVLSTDLWRVNADGTNERMLLHVDGWSLRNGKPSRDGSVIAFMGQQLDEPAFRQEKLGMASVTADGAGNLVWLTEDAVFKTNVDDFAWLPAQPGLLFLTERDGGAPLLSISPSVIQPTEVVASTAQNTIGVQAFNVGGGAIVYAQCNADNPCTLRVKDGKGDRQLWDLNEWVAEKAISKPTMGWITRPDGVKEQYWLMQPTGMEAGKKYPLVLEIHGGPMVMWGPGEASMWHEFQLLCSWGYGVVYCNPRGSGGYGYEFQKKNFQDWGDGPGGDVLAAVDQAMMNDWVDPQKLVVTGGSYGGYLTAWVVGHDHRFKAAVAQRGVYDFSTFFGEGNAWRLLEWCMGGNPYDARIKPVLDRNDPFNSVARIQTPLLIIHSSNDFRTGYSQSEMMYRALKALGRDVEYVRYPEEGHELSRSGDPTRRMDRLDRIVEFFERYTENPRSAPKAKESAWGSVNPN